MEEFWDRLGTKGIGEHGLTAIHFCMSNNIGWELYRSFLGVLQEGSLSGAARSLGITQPTVGRHISALEESLGLALFTRSQTGLMPTEAALALRGHAEAMNSTAAALKRAAESHGEGVKGTVRVSASEVIGVEVLPPIVAALRHEHPLLKVELVLTNRVQDLLRLEADIAVRMTQPKQGLLIARRVGNVVLGLYAHERYVAQRGAPKTPSDLALHSLIGFDEETPFIRAARKALPGWTREVFSLRTDSDLGQLAMIRSGCGIGVCQVALAKRDPSLVRVLPRHFQLKLETWITMHEDLRSSPRCRVTFDALVRGLASHAS
jgi:DNA-binding transcriptional LysR family regulator